MITDEIDKAPSLSMPERIEFLDSLRGLAIIMVVGVHSLAYCLPLQQDYKDIISFIVHAVSVPVFFLVDGFLFARSIRFSKTYKYEETVKKSLLRLLLPWVIFTLVYVITRYSFELIGFLKEEIIIGHSLQEVTIAAYGSVYASQMYFLASLFLIRLCGPIFRRIAIINRLTAMLLLFLCYYSVYKLSIPFISPYLRIDGGQEPILHALWGINFYLVGIILYKTAEIISLRKLFMPFLLIFLVVLLFRGELGYLGHASIIQYLYLITLVLLFVFTGNALSLFARIGKNTMGIYLIHSPIVLKGVSLVLNKIISFPMLNYISILFGTFFVTICIVVAINHIPYGSILFGIPYRRKIS